MCGSKPKIPEPPPPPPEEKKPKPFKNNLDENYEGDGQRKRRKLNQGTAGLTIPLKSGGLNT